MAASVPIAYLVSRYPASNHTFILREVLGLRSLGFDVRVIAIRGADRKREQMTVEEQGEYDRTPTVLPFGIAALQAHGATLWRHPAGYVKGLCTAVTFGGWNPKKIFFWLVYFAEAVVVGRHMERLGIRHAHVHFSSSVILLAARIFPIDYSITIHGPAEFDSVAEFRLGEKVMNAALIVAISSFGRSQIMLASDPECWNRVRVCRLGVNPDVFLPRPEPGGSGPFRVICVGRLASVKAQRVLIGACARLIQSGRNLVLHLVGSGPDQECLQKFVLSLGMQEHVVFEGALNQDQVIALYRQSHAFALASFAEGIPVVLMEAMSMELPCVATWVNGVPELIRDGVEGLLVPPGDEESLAAALERLMDDPNLRQRLGKAGRERVMAQYNLEQNVKKLGEILQIELGLGPTDRSPRKLETLTHGH